MDVEESVGRRRREHGSYPLPVEHPPKVFIATMATEGGPAARQYIGWCWLHGCYDEFKRKSTPPTQYCCSRLQTLQRRVCQQVVHLLISACAQLSQHAFLLHIYD